MNGEERGVNWVGALCMVARESGYKYKQFNLHTGVFKISLNPIYNVTSTNLPLEHRLQQLNPQAFRGFNNLPQNRQKYHIGHKTLPSGQNLYRSIVGKSGLLPLICLKHAEFWMANASSLLQSLHILLYPTPDIGSATPRFALTRPVYLGVSSALHITSSRSVLTQCKACSRVSVIGILLKVSKTVFRRDC